MKVILTDFYLLLVLLGTKWRVTYSWNETSLGFHPANGKKLTVDDLKDLETIEVFKDSCLIGADAAGHSKRQSTMGARPGQRKLSGTTFWINEHQVAVS
jgi:hypothetical protein